MQRIARKMLKPTYSNYNVGSPSIIMTTLLLFYLLLLHTHSITAVNSSTSSPDAATTTTVVDAYIQQCCKVTLYQSLCYTSLSGKYTGPADLGNLTCAAVRLSLTEAISAANYMAAMNQAAGLGQAGPAIRDCTDLTRSAAGQVRRSLKLMMKLVDAYAARGGAYSETEMRKMRFDMSSVQTWLSAGITDQSTCMGGFEDVGVKDGDKMKSQVYERAGIVIKFISNALALVNSYVDDTFHSTSH